MIRSAEYDMVVLLSVEGDPVDVVAATLEAAAALEAAGRPSTSRLVGSAIELVRFLLLLLISVACPPPEIAAAELSSKTAADAEAWREVE
jgi:hypothetical protein